ncbi:MAG: DNA primase [Myxococcales bacterium]|nr:DNA primase [Myxococcales bacterium]
MAGRIAQNVIREITARTDMRAVVGDVVRLSKAGGGSLKGLCPFHNEKTPSFTINVGQKVYYCHGCGAGGDVISFVRETRGLNFGEAVEWLADRVGIQIEREELSPAEQRKRRQERSERARLLDLNRAALACFQRQLMGPAGASARAYLRERGLSEETVQTFGVGCAPDSWDALTRDLIERGFEERELLQLGLAAQRRSGQGLYDRFRDRLMFPVYTAMGDPVAFGGRDLSGTSQAKYMNSPESELQSRQQKFYKKSHVVFGLSTARKGIRTSGIAILVEGNLDVMMMHQHGITNAVCPMGTALTVQQLGEIKRFTDRVALVFDGDKAGRAAMMKSVPKCLEAGLDGVYVLLPEGDDPDTLLRAGGIDAWDEVFAKGKNLIHGWIDAMVAQWDGTIRGKSEILKAVAPILATISDPISHDMAKDYLGTRLLGDRIEDNRRPLNNYLSKAPRRRHEQDTEQPRVALGPAIPPGELNLARTMMWHPHLLPDLETTGALEYVTHDSLRQALLHLIGHAKAQGEVHPSDLPGWLAQVPDDAARRGLLAALTEPAKVGQDDCVPYLEHIIDQLEIAAWRTHKAALTERAQLATDETEQLQLAREMTEAARRIRELNRHLIQTQQAGPNATPPADGVAQKGSVHV